MMSPREAQLIQEVEALRQENKLLRDNVDALIKRLFGASSEKLNADQLMLLLQGDDGPKKAGASSVNCAALEAVERCNQQSFPMPRLPWHIHGAMGWGNALARHFQGGGKSEGRVPRVYVRFATFTPGLESGDLSGHGN